MCEKVKNGFEFLHSQLKIWSNSCIIVTNVDMSNYHKFYALSEFLMKFHFITEITEKIGENVKLLRLVKITLLITVKDLTFKQQLQTLIRALKVINLVIW